MLSKSKIDKLAELCNVYQVNEFDGTRIDGRLFYEFDLYKFVRAVEALVAKEHGVTISTEPTEVYVYGETSLEGVSLPDTVEMLYCPTVTTLDGVALPPMLQELWCNNLTSLKGVVLPATLKVLHCPRVVDIDVVVVPEGCTVYGQTTKTNLKEI